MRRQQAVAAAVGVVVSLLAGLMILWLRATLQPKSYAVLIPLFSQFISFSVEQGIDVGAHRHLRGGWVRPNCINLGQVGQFLMNHGGCRLWHRGGPAEMAHAAPSDLASIVAGAGWSLLAALMKLKWRMNEFITTLMLNFVADYFTQWLISAHVDPGPLAHDKDDEPPGVAGDVHSSVSVAVAACSFAVTWLVWNNKFGYSAGLGRDSFAAAGGCAVRGTSSLPCCSAAPWRAWQGG